MKKHIFSCELEGLNFTDKDYEEVEVKKKPFILTLYTAGVCNVKCPSCFINKYDNKYPELNLEEYKKIINEANELGVKTIKISGAGEPLMSKETLDIIEIARKYAIKVVIYTNGSSIADTELAQKYLGISSNELIKFLKINEVSIVYKFNSIKNSVQDFMVGVKKYSINIYAGLFKLLFFGFNKKNKLGVQTIITPYNYDELEEIYKFCREYEIIPYFETVLKKENAEKNTDLYVSVEKIKNIFLKLSDYDEQENRKIWTPIPSFVGFQCVELKYGMLINNFGYVQVCPGISLKLGNIREKTLHEIWEDIKYKNIRKSLDFLQGKCSSCQLRENKECSYGCRAYSYLKNGQINGEYSECWH